MLSIVGWVAFHVVCFFILARVLFILGLACLHVARVLFNVRSVAMHLICFLSCWPVHCLLLVWMAYIVLRSCLLLN